MTCKSIQIKALMAANAPVAQRAPAVKQVPSSAHAERPASPADDALLALNIDNVHEPSLDVSEPQTNATSSQEEPSANDVTVAATAAPVSQHDSSTSHNTAAIRTSTPLNNTQRSRLDLATETGVHNNSNSGDQSHENDASAINESSIHSSGDATTLDAAAQPRGDDVTAGSSGGGVVASTAAAVASRSSDTPETFHSVTPDGCSHVTDNDDDDGDGGGELTASHNSGTQTDVDDADLHERLRVPIHGYEVMEERSRFTVSTCAVLACSCCDVRLD